MNATEVVEMLTAVGFYIKGIAGSIYLGGVARIDEFHLIV